MMDRERQGFDPYRALEPNLKTGDAINRWALVHARRKIVELLKGQRVLDVCCGTGNLTEMLAAAGCQVVGVDSSATMLAHARRKQVHAEFVQMDARQLPFKQEFEAAVISIALHEMPPQARDEVWEGMLLAVRPAGYLIALDFAVPQRKSPTASIAGRLIEADEHSLVSIHPEHYRNFQEFMRNGGLLGWIEKWSQTIEAEYRFWGGSVAVVMTRQSTMV